MHRVIYGNRPGAEVSVDCGCPLIKLFLLLQCLGYVLAGCRLLRASSGPGCVMPLAFLAFSQSMAVLV